MVLNYQHYNFYISGVAVIARDSVYIVIRLKKERKLASEHRTFEFTSSLKIFVYVILITRAVARSENLGGHIVLGGDNVPPPPCLR